MTRKYHTFIGIDSYLVDANFDCTDFLIVLIEKLVKRCMECPRYLLECVPLSLFNSMDYFQKPCLAAVAAASTINASVNYFFANWCATNVHLLKNNCNNITTILLNYGTKV